MKKFYFLMMMLTIQLITSGAFAADTAEYEAAKESIYEGAEYYIYTEVGGTKYYVTTDGKLTANFESEAGLFTITLTSGGHFGTGFRIDSGTSRFTNPPLSGNTANLKPGNFATTTGDRDDWERQILYLNSDGKYAIRSCNCADGTSSWNDAARTHWSYYMVGDVVTPCYDYTPAYIWNFETTLSDKEKVQAAFNVIYGKYGEQIDDALYDDGGTSMNMGDNFGQHNDWDSWAKFCSLAKEIDAYWIIWGDDSYDPEQDPEALTIDDVKGFRAQLDSLYKVIKDSEVPYTIPHDGYYRIYAFNRYKSTYKPDATGFVDKAMGASFLKKHENTVVFGTLGREKANYVWELKKSESGDSILMKNVGMETYINYSSFKAGKLTTTDDVNQAAYVIFDYAYGHGNEDAEDVNQRYSYGPQTVYPGGVQTTKDIFCIRNPQEPRDGNYFHQNGHSSVNDANSPWTPWTNYGTDTGDEQEMAFWRRTWDYDHTRSDLHASEWYLEEVSEEEVQELLQGFPEIRDHETIVAMNNALRDKVYDALKTAKDTIRTKLIASASQMTSPYSQNDFGNRDGDDLSAGPLIDGDKGTYWHSVYNNPPQEQHYIQIADMQDMVGMCEFYFCERAGAGNDRPKEFVLLGSNDPDAADDDWVRVCDPIKIPNYSAGAESTVTFNVEAPYNYIRVVCVDTDGSEGYRYFWHAAELQIISVKENPKSQFVTLGDVAEQLEATYLSNVAIADDDMTSAIYNALMDAYKDFLAAMVDPTELRTALSTYANVTAGVVSGDEPGQWNNADVATDYETLYAEVDAYDKAGLYDAEKNHKYSVMLKAMQKSVLEQANTVDTDTWYNIMFPTEEMFTRFGFDPKKVGGDSQVEYHPNQWGYFVTPGVREDIKELNDDGEEVSTGKYTVTPYTKDDIREGKSNWLFFIDEQEVENPDVSEFRFIKKEQEMTKEDYPAFFSEFKDYIDMALDLGTSFTRGEALITDASQLSSNASDKSEGQHIDYLIDEDVKTYWHSDYHQEVLEPGYIQVALKNPVSGLIQVDISRRQNATNGHIVRMFVLGSNDAQTWTNIGYLETPFTNQNESVTSLPLDLDGTYSYLRFILTRRYGTDGGGNMEFDPFAEITNKDDYNKLWTYFHASEFQIYPVTPVNMSDKAKALLTTAKNVLIKDATAEDVAAVAEAYRAYRLEYNTAQGKDILPSGRDKKAPLYAIQNKATGLYINCNPNTAAENSLELVPTYFDVTPVGFERMLLHGFSFDNKNCRYLHSQNFDHRFVTWNDTQVDYNSALALRIAEPVEPIEEFTFYRDVKPGEINSWISPYNLTLEAVQEAALYTALGRFYVADEGSYLALKQIQSIPAGEPVIYIYGDTLDSYDPDDDYVESIMLTRSAAEELVLEADTINGLVGSFANHPLAAREIYFEGNHPVCIGQTGYQLLGPCVSLDLDICPSFDPNEDYDFAIFLGEAGDMAVGVENIPASVEKVSQPGNVYSIDGKLLRTGATLNSLKSMGKGMYILNGVKVLVK